MVHRFMQAKYSIFSAIVVVFYATIRKIVRGEIEGVHL